jgi:hypothetical protein
MNNGIYEVKCINPIQKFKKNEIYAFKIYKNPNEPYVLTEVESNMCVMLSSEISINNYFKILNSDTDSEVEIPKPIKRKRGRPKKNQ